MAEQIKFYRRRRTSVRRRKRKKPTDVNEIFKDVQNYYLAFAKLIDACGIYSYYTKMVDRYPDNSYYKGKADSMIDEIDIITDDLAEYAMLIDWKIGRREKLARLLINSKDRRKFYKSYLVRYWNTKQLTLSPGDLEAMYQSLLEKRRKKEEKEKK